MELSLQDAKIELIQWLAHLDDEKIISKLLAFREMETTVEWSKLSEAEQLSILAGLEEANNGKLIEHSEVRKRYEKWL